MGPVRKNPLRRANVSVLDKVPFNWKAGKRPVL